MNYVFRLLALVSLPLLSPSEAGAFPKPELTHEQMLEESDLVVEGKVIGVNLVKRWIGDKAGVNIGYEQGHFDVWFLVSKPIKGDAVPGQTINYFVHAYMEGLWKKPPPMGFVYEGTEDAVKPGSRLRIYLKWDDKNRRYTRVHFNSGFVVIEKSKEAYPTTPGAPIFDRPRPAESGAPATSPR